MELKEILNQNSQKASSKSNYISRPSGHSNEAFSALNLLEAIRKVAESITSRKSHLGARYGAISCALVKTSTKECYTSTHHLLNKNTHQTKI